MERISSRSVTDLLRPRAAPEGRPLPVCPDPQLLHQAYMVFEPVRQLDIEVCHTGRPIGLDPVSDEALIANEARGSQVVVGDEGRRPVPVSPKYSSWMLRASSS